MKTIEIAEFGEPEVLVLRDVVDPQGDDGVAPINVTATENSYLVGGRYR
jgi:hypothetical protein